jgi:hypothetical protein
MPRMRWLAFLLLLVSTPAAAGHVVSPLELEASAVGGDGPDDGRVTGRVFAAGRARVQEGAFRWGLDVGAGLSAPYAKVYDVALYPVGVGARLGSWSHVGVEAGLGASGGSASIDDAVLFPVAADLDLAVGARVTLLARARLSWLALAPSRRHGTPLPFGDELDASLALRLGRRWDDGYENAAAGPYLGISYRAAQGVSMFGVVLGWSVAGY